MHRGRKKPGPIGSKNILERMNRLMVESVRTKQYPAAIMLSPVDALELERVMNEMGAYGLGETLHFLGCPVLICEGALAPQALWPVSKAKELLARA